MSNIFMIVWLVSTFTLACIQSSLYPELWSFAVLFLIYIYIYIYIYDIGLINTYNIKCMN